MNEPEILETLATILRGEGSDEEFGKWIEELKRETGCPNILGLIKYAEQDDTAETILKKAREYKPIQLGSGGQQEPPNPTGESEP